MLHAEKLSKRLTRPEPQARDDHPKRKFLAFTLSLEEYCIDLSLVQEILDFDAVESIPDTPDFIKGMLRFRGELIPAVDMRVLFNLGAPACDAYTPIIIIRANNQYLALIVDCVLDEMEIDSMQIRQIYSTANPGFDFMMATSVVKQRKIVILDVKKLVAIPDVQDCKSSALFH